MSLLSRPSIVTRTFVAKLTGSLIGLAGLLGVPYLLPEIDWMTRIGIFLWYTTMGASIGLFGVFTSYRILALPIPWWVRGPFVGAWMNCVLVFFAHEKMAGILSLFGTAVSPFWWFTAVGAVVGTLIDYVATRSGGEGPETLDR